MRIHLSYPVSASTLPRRSAPMPRRSRNGASIGRPRAWRPMNGCWHAAPRLRLRWAQNPVLRISLSPVRSLARIFLSSNWAAFQSWLDWPTDCSRYPLSLALIPSSSRDSNQARSIDRRCASDIKAKHSGGVSAGDLGQGRIVHALHPCDVSNGIIFGHVERIIGTHQDTIGAEDVDQVCELVIGENHGVEIDLPQIGRR